MAARTVLVTGATGLLGRQVLRAFDMRGWCAKGTGLSRADGSTILRADLSSGAEIEKALHEIRPHVVVHCAAQRFPDKVDKDPEASRALNVEATRTLAKLCAAQDILLIYISTDYVFPGRPGEAPYEATASPNPTNLYGQTKLDGENAMLDEYNQAGKKGKSVILRVPVLYGKAETPGESAVNVLMDTVWKSQEKESKIQMDHWAIRYPTNTEDVGKVCHDIANAYLDASDKDSLPSTLHFSSEDSMTKYEICQTFADILGLPMDDIVANTAGNDPTASVQRPYDCHLSTRALKELGIDVSTNDFVAWWRREAHAFRH